MLTKLTNQAISEEEAWMRPRLGILGRLFGCQVWQCQESQVKVTMAVAFSEAD